MDIDEEEAKRPPEEKEEPEILVSTWTHHYVVQVELCHPLQIGEHNRFYMRYNIAHDECRMSNGILELPVLGEARIFIPMSNVVTWSTRYVFIRRFDDGDDWIYEPTIGSLIAEHPVGTYNRKESDGGVRVVGTLYESGIINRYPG